MEFAATCGIDVHLTRTPDMLLDGIPCEVKSLRWLLPPSLERFARKIKERASKAFRNQGACLVVLDIGLLLFIWPEEKQSSPNSYKHICPALHKGLALAPQNARPMLPYYYDPWSGAVTSRVICYREFLPDFDPD